MSEIIGRGILKKTSLLNRRNSLLRRFTQSSTTSKVWPSSSAAVADITDGASIAFGGFGLCGIPENLIKALANGTNRPSKLDCISNDAGTVDYGLGILISNKQVARLRASYVGEHKKIADLMTSGALELELVPQGTLAEKLRSGGAGIPAIYVPAGVDTVVQHGTHPKKYDNSGHISAWTEPKESRVFNGKTYLLEESITADYALIKGFKADTAGNVVFKDTARNFNPDCAKAGRCTIVEVEEIVEAGTLKPDEIHLPGIYVNRIVKGEVFERRIEKLTIRPRPTSASDAPLLTNSLRSPAYHIIARRAAKEFKNGMYVNLGIGVPTLASNYIPPGVSVELQSENGLLGMGPYPYEDEYDADLINAGKETVSYLAGSSTFSSSDSFAMIRGGHVDLTILGTLEVSQGGDIANWVIPGKMIKGMGGAMDLVAACKRVVIVTTHTQKNGKSKILKKCSLPLTGRGVVDLIVTELAVFEVLPERKGLMLIEHAEGVSVEEIRAKTDASFVISPRLGVMSQ